MQVNVNSSVRNLEIYLLGEMLVLILFFPLNIPR